LAAASRRGFAPEARLELIEGEIVERARIGSRHAGMVD